MQRSKILYLHGLDSFLQDDRRAVLEQKVAVFAPKLDYLNTENLFENLCQEYAEVDAIIGSSAGGLVAYYLAQRLDKPCLLFNPALAHREKMPFPIGKFHSDFQQFMQIVVGLQDAVINPIQTFDLVRKDLLVGTCVAFHIINTMEHSYPIEIFSSEFDFFSKRVGL